MVASVERPCHALLDAVEDAFHLLGGGTPPILPGVDRSGRNRQHDPCHPGLPSHRLQRPASGRDTGIAAATCRADHRADGGSGEARSEVESWPSQPDDDGADPVSTGRAPRITRPIGSPKRSFMTSSNGTPSAAIQLPERRQ